VLDLGKRLEWFSADALRGRIGCDKIGKLGFQIGKFLVEAVVFAVADDRRGVLVVKLVMLPDFLSQVGNFFGGFLSVHCVEDDTAAQILGNR